MRPQLDRAQQHQRAAIRSAGAFALLIELRWVVRHEVAGLPIALEHGGELGEHGGVASRGGPHVPLEPGHLRGVGEVRRPDIRRREALGSVEHPCLRVESRGSDVVRDAHICTECDELVESCPLGGVGVRRRQHTQRPAGLGVTPQRGEQRADTAAPDEGHHHVDGGGRLDLGTELGPQCRFTGSIRQQRGVEQRCQRCLDARRRTVDVAATNTREHRGGIDGQLRPVERDELAQSVQQRPGDANADLRPLVVGDVEQRALDLVADVPGDAIGRVGGG